MKEHIVYFWTTVAEQLGHRVDWPLICGVFFRHQVFVGSA
jgi:hypothetical protein